MKIRFAIAPGLGVTDPSSLRALVDGLETRGFDTIWLSDIPLGPSIDPLAGLAFAAGRTTRLKLGANVVPFGRSPMLLAKELAHLDQLSDGRLLLSFVPGLDQPGEREALGIGRADRGRTIESVIALLRRWWAGEAVTGELGPYRFDALSVRPSPRQDPLEIWLGGIGPAALDRVGRVGDGWLGAALGPDEAAAARLRIEAAAGAAGRVVDPEHFGLSLAYARSDPDPATLETLRARRPDVDPADLLPVGRPGLRNIVQRYCAAGISKFVLRPTGVGTTDWADELDWLADAVLDLQT